MKCKLIAIAAMIALLMGCAAGTAQISKPVTQEAQAKRDQMVGRWYGNRPIENGTFEWIVERHDDGTYLVHFRYPDSESGEDVEQREVGLWGVSGDIYFTMTRGWVYGDMISPGDPANANLYGTTGVGPAQLLELLNKAFLKVPDSDVKTTFSIPK